MTEDPGRRPADGGADQPADDVFAQLVSHFDDEPVEHSWPAAEDVTGPSGATNATDDAPDDATGEDGAARAGEDRTPMGPTGASSAASGSPAPGSPVSGLAGGSGGAGGWPGGRSGRDLLDDAVGRSMAGDTGWRRPGDAAAGDGDELDEDEHYVPPPPPKAGWVRPATGLALGSVALGVIILMVPSLMNEASSGAGDIVGVLLILGGVGALVARLSERSPDDEDDPDSGAVL